MKNSSKSTKNSSKDDDEARRMKRKSKKRPRERPLSASSSDSDDVYTKRKRRRKEAKRKTARCSSSDDDSTLRRKGRKKSRKSEVEYRKRSSKVKQKRRRNRRLHKDSSVSSSSDYSSSESCSTCRDSYSSDEEGCYRRSKREENIRKGGSKRDESKKESGKGSGRGVNGHGSGSSSSCSECRGNRVEMTKDVRRLVKKINGDQETANEGLEVQQVYEEGVSGKDDECQADHEDGAENAIESKYIDENERWEMGAGNDTLVGASSSIVKLNPESDPQNGNSPHAPIIVHNGRGSQNGSPNSRQYEIHSNYCEAGGEDDTSINIGSSLDRDLEAILRQKALENLKRFHNKQQGKVQAIGREHADGGELTLTTAKTVGEGSGRTSSIKSDSIGEGISERMLVRGHCSGVPGVEDRDLIGNNRLSNYSDSSRARSIISSVHISTACNTDKKDKNSEVTEAGKAGGGASDNKNSAFKQNRSSNALPQTAGSNVPPTTMSRERETKAAATSISTLVHDLDANGTDRVPSVPSVGSGSAITNFEQTGGKSMTTDASQFEQKTMSVMRGGEMVQVSYKVYIPKKAPALARRQLQR